MTTEFMLVVEAQFHVSYLISEWIKLFGEHPGFIGIIVRETSLSDEKIRAREEFHIQHHGTSQISQSLITEAKQVYPELTDTEKAMITAFGIPEHSVTYYPQTYFLGPDLNSSEAEAWVAEKLGSSTSAPFLFVFLDQILKPFWLEATHRQIINAHSAVLPYARGMYAIEQLALTEKRTDFANAAGATIHYIDDGIDTGPIIKSYRFSQPFGFDSLWELKGYSFHLAFRLLIEVAKEIATEQMFKPMGMYPRDIGPNFLSRNFTTKVRKKAEQAYLGMKMAVG